MNVLRSEVLESPNYSYGTTPLLIKFGEAAACMRTTVDVTSGDSAFAILASVWELHVVLRSRGLPANYNVVRHVLEAMLAGAFAIAAESRGELDAFHQTPIGFVLRFSPGRVDIRGAVESSSAVTIPGRVTTIEPTGRRYLKKVSVELDFVHTAQREVTATPEVLRLGDYCLHSLFRRLEQLFPAIFAPEYERIDDIRSMFRPLAQTLRHAGGTGALELAAEHRFLWAPLIQADEVLRARKAVSAQQAARRRVRPGPSLLRPRRATGTMKGNRNGANSLPWCWSDHKYIANIEANAYDYEIVFDQGPGVYLTHEPIYFEDLEKG